MDERDVPGLIAAAVITALAIGYTIFLIRFMRRSAGARTRFLQFTALQMLIVLTSIAVLLGTWRMVLLYR